MAVNLSVKNVPDALADQLRARAKRNHRSLQRELLSILEAVADERAKAPPVDRWISIDEAIARARELFPQGTQNSVAFIRAVRDDR